MRHPSAIIHPEAKLDDSVKVGPCAVIDEHAVIGANTEIGPNVYITGHTTLGENNRVHAGCVLGDAPQDLKYEGGPTRLVIGDGNTFREHVTIHRANNEAEETKIGSNNFFMANSHVGHNAHVGNHVMLANGALLAGHVRVDDRVFISGNCLAHQFVRIGTLALMQGGSAISKDLPPYTVARGDNGIAGLNVIGLRRAGMNGGQRQELKHLYHVLFRHRKKMSQAVSEAQEQFDTPEAKTLIEFVLKSERGLCADRGR